MIDTKKIKELCRECLKAKAIKKGMCNKCYLKEWRANNKEHINKWRRNYYKKYYAEYSYKTKARQQAIRKIRIPKGSKCNRCGKEAEQRHHKDHRKPLVVRLLCKDCHRKEDKE